MGISPSEVGERRGRRFAACLHMGPVLGQGNSPHPVPEVSYDAPSAGSQDGNRLLPPKDLP